MRIHLLKSLAIDATTDVEAAMVLADALLEDRADGYRCTSLEEAEGVLRAAGMTETADMMVDAMGHANEDKRLWDARPMSRYVDPDDE